MTKCDIDVYRAETIYDDDVGRWQMTTMHDGYDDARQCTTMT